MYSIEFGLKSVYFVCINSFVSRNSRWWKVDRCLWLIEQCFDIKLSIPHVYKFWIVCHLSNNEWLTLSHGNFIENCCISRAMLHNDIFTMKDIIYFLFLYSIVGIHMIFHSFFPDVIIFKIKCFIFFHQIYKSIKLDRYAWNVKFYRIKISTPLKKL